MVKKKFESHRFTKWALWPNKCLNLLPDLGIWSLFCATFYVYVKWRQY